ncbi:hypothetical protein EVAR_101769_1 [Eumeta japonica]|uniref:Uncharacterized protein n=1 Tax=Eumeta variegata TaxID=151549 RepID=A0A4C1SN95_EUMVA|nr:hypothetical protein EVAR_101769_1 [Eumeta japonica]
MDPRGPVTQIRLQRAERPALASRRRSFPVGVHSDSVSRSLQIVQFNTFYLNPRRANEKEDKNGGLSLCPRTRSASNSHGVKNSSRDDIGRTFSPETFAGSSDAARTTPARDVPMGAL